MPQQGYAFPSLVEKSKWRQMKGQNHWIVPRYESYHGNTVILTKYCQFHATQTKLQHRKPKYHFRLQLTSFRSAQLARLTARSNHFVNKFYLIFSRQNSRPLWTASDEKKTVGTRNLGFVQKLSLDIWWKLWYQFYLVLVFARITKWFHVMAMKIT